MMRYTSDAVCQPSSPRKLPPNAGRHRWARKRVNLPCDNMEKEFHSLVAAQGQLRAARRCSPSQEAPQRAKKPLRAKTLPKYLLTACLSRGATCCASISKPPSRATTPGLEQKQDPRTERYTSQSPLPEPLQPQGPLHVVESLASFYVHSDDFGLTKVPARMWLLLDGLTVGGKLGSEGSPLPSSLSATCSENQDHESNEEGFTSGDVAILAETQHEIMLSAAAGGGVVMATDGAQLLRSVPRERLHVKAAEANFKRAIRGSSPLVLKHAALIEGLLKEQDAWVQCRAPDPLDNRHLYQTHSPLEPFGTHLLDSVTRARRAEEYVVSQAVAEKERISRAASATSARRDDGEEEDKTLEAEEYWEDDPATLQTLTRGFQGRSELHPKSVLHRGYEVLCEFMDFAHRRFGNSIRTWFQLDPEVTLRLGEKQFLRRCDEIGFQGNTLAMFKYLDSAGTGVITLLDFDPPVAIILAKFKQLMESTFGTITESFAYLDENSSGKLYKDEFVKQIRALGYKGPAARLHDLLDRQGFGVITLPEMVFLKAWQPPQYLFSEANAESLKAVKGALRFMHNTILSGWRKVMDVDSNMRVSWVEFATSCRGINWRSLPSAVSSAFPKTLEELTCAWRAVDVNCSGWIALREFDFVSWKALSDFKRWADRTHGGCLHAFRAMDNSGYTSNGKLSLGELKRGTKGYYAGDFELLFDGLDIGNTGSLTENEVKFLDYWDVDFESWQIKAKNRAELDKALERRRSKRQSTHDVRRRNAVKVFSESDRRKSLVKNVVSYLY